MLTALDIKILAGLALVAAVLVGLWAYDSHEQALGAAEGRAKAAEQALVGEQESRRESDRRAVAVSQEANHADQAASAARADADAARTADERLRLRLAAAERLPAAIGASAPAPGATAESPAAVPFVVFDRIDGAAGQLADYADQLRISLDACVGSYGALTK